MKYLFFLFFAIPILAFSQVGIGTDNPTNALDINSENFGLVVPRVATLSDVTDTQTNRAIQGTIVYVTDIKSFCFKIGDVWKCMTLNINDRIVIVERDEDGN